MRLDNIPQIVTIENAEQYARIFTVVVKTQSYGHNDYSESGNVSRVAGAILLAIAPGEVLIEPERTDYYNGQQTKIPAKIAPGLTLIFGVKRDDAMAAILEENGQLRTAASDVRDKLTAAQRELDPLKKEVEALKVAVVEREQSALAWEGRVNTIADLRRKLEGDLVKIKRHIGEKAYNDALAETSK